MSECHGDRPSTVVVPLNDNGGNGVTSNCNCNCYCYQLNPSRSSDGLRFNRNLSLIAFVLSIIVIFDRFTITTFAAPQSCALCRQNDLKADAKDPGASYEEFLFEHQVTRQDAIRALRMLNDSFFEESSASAACKAVSCTKIVMKYCLGPQFINDHCWCELGHTQEGLPFIPHICYVGEKEYSASVGSCFFYEEVKDCCCASALAKQWRHISAAGLPTASFSIILFAVLMYVVAGKRFCI